MARVDVRSLMPLRHFRAHRNQNTIEQRQRSHVNYYITIHARAGRIHQYAPYMCGFRVHSPISTGGFRLRANEKPPTPRRFSFPPLPAFFRPLRLVNTTKNHGEKPPAGTVRGNRSPARSNRRTVRAFHVCGDLSGNRSPDRPERPTVPRALCRGRDDLAGTPDRQQAGRGNGAPCGRNGSRQSIRQPCAGQAGRATVATSPETGRQRPAVPLARAGRVRACPDLPAPPVPRSRALWPDGAPALAVTISPDKSKRGGNRAPSRSLATAKYPATVPRPI